ncbi:MAG: hypothetical protein ACI857_002792, partial [Arenicella sp.]
MDQKVVDFYCQSRSKTNNRYQKESIKVKNLIQNSRQFSNQKLSLH